MKKQKIQKLKKKINFQTKCYYFYYIYMKKAFCDRYRQIKTDKIEDKEFFKLNNFDRLLITLT